MYGAFLALGNVTGRLGVSQITAAWPGTSLAEAAEPTAGVTLVRFMPRHTTKNPPAFAWSTDRQLLLCVDGYVVTDNVGEHGDIEAQTADLAELFRSRGVVESLRFIAAGSYVIFVVDLARNACCVICDDMGSLPLYVSSVPDGYLLSTNPVALANTGLIDNSLDTTACAEWALNGYAIGDRYPLKGIRTLKIGEMFRWDGRSSRGETVALPDPFWSAPLLERKPKVQEITGLFAQACRRIAAIDPAPANLQSAGMDSRLILASWPSGYNPPCYTYGNPEAHEIGVARSIAHIRGSLWHHVWEDPDVVADNLDRMFSIAGVLAWPDRYFAGVQMARDGHRGTLDGLMGDALLGGSFHTFDRRFSLGGKIARRMGRLLDQPVSRFGLDRIASEMLDNITQVKDPGGFREFINDDFAQMILDEKPNILADIRQEMTECLPPNDSLAHLWRNFLLRNRVPHMTVQQAVMCRASVNVYTPFANDRDLTRFLLGLRQKDIAAARLYLRLFREVFPDYAKVPWGASLIPLQRSALQHKVSKLLISRGRYIPFLTSKTHGRPLDPNSWGVWLKRSARMRDYGLVSMREAGFLNETNAASALRDIAAGAKQGTGKLFHFASIARWLTFSSRSARGGVRTHAGTS